MLRVVPDIVPGAIPGAVSKVVLGVVPEGVSEAVVKLVSALAATKYPEVKIQMQTLRLRRPQCQRHAFRLHGPKKCVNDMFAIFVLEIKKQKILKIENMSSPRKKVMTFVNLKEHLKKKRKEKTLILILMNIVKGALRVAWRH